MKIIFEFFKMNKINEFDFCKFSMSFPEHGMYSSLNSFLQL